MLANDVLESDGLHSLLQQTLKDYSPISGNISSPTSSFKMALDPIKHYHKKAQDSLVAHAGAWTQDASSSPSKSVVCAVLLQPRSLADHEDFQGWGKSRGLQEEGWEKNLNLYLTIHTHEMIDNEPGL